MAPLFLRASLTDKWWSGINANTYIRTLTDKLQQLRASHQRSLLPATITRQTSFHSDTKYVLHPKQSFRFFCLSEYQIFAHQSLNSLYQSHVNYKPPYHHTSSKATTHAYTKTSNGCYCLPIFRRLRSPYHLQSCRRYGGVQKTGPGSSPRQSPPYPKGTSERGHDGPQCGERGLDGLF